MAASARIEGWVGSLAHDDPLRIARDRLEEACGQIAWASDQGRRRAVKTGLRLMLVRDYDRVSQLTEEDLKIPPPGANLTDILDQRSAGSWSLRPFTTQGHHTTPRPAAEDDRRAGARPGARTFPGRDNPLYDRLLAPDQQQLQHRPHKDPVLWPTSGTYLARASIPRRHPLPA